MNRTSIAGLIAALASCFWWPAVRRQTTRACSPQRPMTFRRTSSCSWTTVQPWRKSSGTNTTTPRNYSPDRCTDAGPKCAGRQRILPGQGLRHPDSGNNYYLVDVLDDLMVAD